MKDTLCKYYTNSSAITGYMVSMLNLKNMQKILEPSAGGGAFIDEILKTQINVEIDALDIDYRAIATLEKKYNQTPNVHIRHADTLLDTELDLISSLGGVYDCVIGNPPYGAWQNFERRAHFKKLYGNINTKETYGLFLLRSVHALRVGGRLSFIIPDTFLFLKSHEELRRFILENCKIVEILIFPSSFFPGISFGYSNLAIISLEKSDYNAALDNEFYVIRGFTSPEDFSKIEKKRKSLSVFNLIQRDILQSEHAQFLLGKGIYISILQKTTLKLSDIANIVTGLYTGDNEKYVRYGDKIDAKHHQSISPDLIYECNDIRGIQNIVEGYIPYIKGASKRKFVKSGGECYVRWDAAAIQLYKSSPKARFQNSGYYFREGIALPMVKAKTIKAFYMKGNVFDQSIVGIFPKDPSKLLYILALLNSDIINDIIHIINPTANNSANYLKQIPYIEADPVLFQFICNKTSTILKSELNHHEFEELSKELSDLFNDIYLNAH